MLILVLQLLIAVLSYISLFLLPAYLMFKPVNV